MANAYLGVGIARSDKLVQYLSINHGSSSLKYLFTEKPGWIEFESAIDITYMDAENQSN